MDVAATVGLRTAAGQDGGGRTENRREQVNPQVFEMSADTAGASERAGFIDAPQIGPANKASNALTAPTAAPAMTYDGSSSQINYWQPISQRHWAVSACPDLSSGDIFGQALFSFDP